MCGVAGYFGTHELSSNRVASCLELMRLRGPDDEGVATRKTRSGGNLYLLHSRLSLLDPDRRSRQPFERGKNLLSFNGEIYNYRELRHGLIQSGSTFHTTGDTEVLSELLALGGLASAAAWEGMWAFAWFDGESEELYLCRDRFGEKPLFVFEGEDGVYFGSEPKFIFALLGRTLPVNYAQVKRYLVNGYKSLFKGRDTFFEGLSEISPGTYRSFSPGVTKNVTYWHPNFEAQDDSVTYADAVSRTREALLASVELRLRADAPLAFLLSGGVDSNALVAIAKRELGQDVHGFTVMNTDARYEERDMVEATVRELRLEHTKVSIETSNFLDNMRDLVAYHDSPVSTISSYAHSRLMLAINRAGYKISVGGIGADELFSGYFDHHNAYLAAMKRENVERYREALEEWSADVSHIVRNPFLRDPEYFIKNPDSRAHIFLDSSRLATALVEPFAEPFRETRYAKTLLRNRMANEIMHEAVPVLLREEDLNAMYCSVENRSPFLDKTLFEVAQSIPTRHLIQKGRAKAVLRDSVEGLVPRVVTANPRKVGFNAPLHDYLDRDHGGVRRELLEDSPIYEVVRRDSIEALLGKSELPNSQSKFLFSFISAKFFLEDYV